MAVAIQRYYLWIIAGVGIPANILAILGVWSLGHLLPAAVLVLALSITDAVTLVLKLIANQVSIYDPHMTTLACRLEFIVISFGTLANWILVGIAIDRFLWLKRQRALRSGGGQIMQSQGRKEEADKIEEGDTYFCIKLFRRDAQGFVWLTNIGVVCVTGLIAHLILVLYGVVFFIMRDVGRSGRKCSVYKKYEEFWKNGWFIINTGLFFFVPFAIILVLTVISVRWLILDKREAPRAKLRSDDGTKVSKSDAKAPQDQPRDEIDQAIPDDSQKPVANTGDQENNEATSNERDGKQSEITDATRQTSDKLEHGTEEPVSGSQTKEGGSPLEMRNQTALTAMMVLAATFFLILCLPGCVFYLSYQVKSDPTLKAKWLLFEQIQFILVDMSHALNFFIYFIGVKTFRDSLIRLVTCKGKRR